MFRIEDLSVNVTVEVAIGKLDKYDAYSEVDKHEQRMENVAAKVSLSTGMREASLGGRDIADLCKSISNAVHHELDNEFKKAQLKADVKMAEARNERTHNLKKCVHE